MHRSLNFVIDVTSFGQESHPRGLAFAEEIHAIFAAKYTVEKQVENWRDCGWEYGFEAGGEEYLAVLCCLAGSTTGLLQISPRRLPAALLRLIGFKVSATDDGLARRRSEIEELLRANPRVAALKFAYDRYPS